MTRRRTVRELTSMSMLAAAGGVVVSVAVCVWAARFHDHRYGGRGLAVLSVLVYGLFLAVLAMPLAALAGTAHETLRTAPAAGVARGTSKGPR
jgi:hypothetical protein